MSSPFLLPNVSAFMSHQCYMVTWSWIRWLPRGTAEFIQRHGQRVVHPREKTHEEKMKAWESKVTFVERQVIDPCLESDMGERYGEKRTITNFNELVIDCKGPPLPYCLSSLIGPGNQPLVV